MAGQGRIEMVQRKRPLKLLFLLQWLSVVMATLVFAAACSRTESPEEQIRMFVKTGEEAVEARELGNVKKLISEQYLDQGQRTKRDMVALVARYLYVNKNIHLLTRIDQLNFPAPDKAQFHLYVAMTGQNVSDLDSLLNMQADLYRFDMELAREEDDWQLVRSTWRPAQSTDFF